MNTTPGIWIVKPATEESPDGVFLHRIISIGPNGDTLVALVRSMADAALMCAAQETTDALREIIGELMNSKTPIDLIRLQEIGSRALEKIAAESGEL